MSNRRAYRLVLLCLRLARRIAALLLLSVIVAQAARADSGIYVCTTLSEAGACTAFAEISGGMATLGDVGLTPEAITVAIGIGLGLVLVCYAIGVSLGALRRIIDGVFGGSLGP
jgi:uncharacterized membrane protein YhfC